MKTSLFTKEPRETLNGASSSSNMINETSDAFDLRALPKATFEILNELFSIGILTEFSELVRVADKPPTGSSGIKIK